MAFFFMPGHLGSTDRQHQHGDVVVTTGLIGQLDETKHLLRTILAAKVQAATDRVFVDHMAQTVGTKQQ